MKKMVLFIIFCSLTLMGCAGYSFYQQSCHRLDEVLFEINIYRIDPVIGFMDELFLSAMEDRNKHYSKLEE